MIFLKIATFSLMGFAIVDELRADLSVIADWKYVDYDFDSSEQKNQAIQSGNYDFTKNHPIDIDVSADGKIFMTLLRKKGVPASLTTLTKPGLSESGSYLLRPYPNWSWANLSDCDHGLIGVHRVATDACNCLWVLDSGVSENELVCPPKLLSFDMTSNELLSKNQIPDDLVYGDNGRTLFTSIVVETEGDNCAETTVYMADSLGFGLMLWNGIEFWRFQSPYFEAIENASTFSVIGDESINLVVGLFGMAMKNDQSDALKRTLYFQPMSSYDEYHVAVSELHTHKNDTNSVKYMKEPSELKGQSTAQAFSIERKTVLFFNSVIDSSVLCWNTIKPLSLENTGTVAHNLKTLQWQSGLKIIPQKGSTKETLWVVSNRLERFLNNNMNFNETNFRILVGNVDDLVRGTVCE